jgi:DNA-binding CsgD family transcriptional regulator
MGQLKRPDLAAGPLRDLNDALHVLHRTAGWPSLRVLVHQLAAVSRGSLHALFSSGTLPTWGYVELVVEQLANTARLNQRAERDRFHELWLKAAEEFPSPPRVHPQAAKAQASMARLSPRERLVLKHLATGAKVRAVARDLGLAESTVHVHMKRAVERLQVALRFWDGMVEPFVWLDRPGCRVWLSVGCRLWLEWLGHPVPPDDPAARLGSATKIAV